MAELWKHWALMPAYWQSYENIELWYLPIGRAMKTLSFSACLLAELWKHWAFGACLLVELWKHWALMPAYWQSYENIEFLMPAYWQSYENIELLVPAKNIELLVPAYWQSYKNIEFWCLPIGRVMKTLNFGACLLVGQWNSSGRLT